MTTLDEVKQIRESLQAGTDITPAQDKGRLILIEETFALEREVLANAMITLGMTGDAMKARASAAITHAKFDALMQRKAVTQ